MFDNPYRIGLPVTGDQFYNRGDILEQLCRFDEKAYFLNGVRRIGKSSILLQMEELIRQKNGYTPIYCTLQSHRTTQNMGRELARKIRNRIKDNNLTNTVEFDQPQAFEEIIEKWVDYCRNNSLKSFLLIDEGEQLHSLEQNSIESLSRIFNESSDVLKIIIAGTRTFYKFKGDRNDLIQLTQRFISRYVGHVSLEDTKNIINQSNVYNTEIASQDQVELIYNYCGGHPYLIQFVCDELFNPHTFKLNLGSEREMLPSDQLYNFFEDDYSYLDDSQKKILNILSLSNEINYEKLFGEIKESKDEMEKALDELINLGFVKNTENHLKIGYLFLSKWIKNKKVNKKALISFAPGDQEHKKSLLEHLIIYKRMGILETWDYDDILGGEDDKEAFIRGKMENSDLLIFLITKDLLNFDRVMNSELHWALELQNQKQLRIVPIHVTKSISLLIKSTPFEDFSPLPGNGKSIEDYANVNEAWVEVATSIRKIIDSL